MEESTENGKFPIRKDILVLPADDPKKLQIGYAIYETVGAPIETVEGERIGKDKLRVGMEVKVHGLTQSYISTIESIDGDKAKVKYLYAHLEYDTQRECWVNRYFGDDTLTMIDLKE
jgi:hypothetical protein